MTAEEIYPCIDDSARTTNRSTQHLYDGDEGGQGERAVRGAAQGRQQEQQQGAGSDSEPSGGSRGEAAGRRRAASPAAFGAGTRRPAAAMGAVRGRARRNRAQQAGKLVGHPGAAGGGPAASRNCPGARCSPTTCSRTPRERLQLHAPLAARGRDDPAQPAQPASANWRWRWTPPARSARTTWPQFIAEINAIKGTLPVRA
ncbi:MAG: hypothetical protein MZW92_47785 [Comamonadaceae bacterium]|nr:hypothetical protein [Comamonadaceae bacterium]